MKTPALLSLCLLWVLSQAHAESDYLPIEYWSGIEGAPSYALSTTNAAGTSKIAIFLEGGSSIVQGVTSHNKDSGRIGVSWKPRKDLPVSPYWSHVGNITDSTTDLEDSAASGGLFDFQKTDTRIHSATSEMQFTLEKIATQHLWHEETKPFHGITLSIEIEGPQFLNPNDQVLGETLRAVGHKTLSEELRSIPKRIAAICKNSEKQGSVRLHWRLLHYSPMQCSLVLIRTTQICFSRTNVDYTSLNFRKTQDGWKAVNPLGTISDKSKLLATIRDQLNKHGADGDFFFEHYGSDYKAAEKLFHAIALPECTWLIFAPYTVASGAQGTISIPLPKTK